jgi:putative oxidoreductase
MNIWTTRMLSLLRITAALLFKEHGLMKLFHFPGPQSGVSDPLSPMLSSDLLFQN